MTNPINPHKPSRPTTTGSNKKQYHSFDPRRWGQWLIRQVSKPKKSTFHHITNPETALKMLDRQKRGIRTPIISEDMNLFKTVGQGSSAKVDMVSPDKAGPISVRKQLSDPEDPESLIREEEAILSRLDHPNIVKVASASQERVPHADNPPHIYMEFGGATLDELPPQENMVTIKKTMGQLVDTLDYLRTQNVIHFDIKPQNILLNPNNKHILLADFGLAVQTDDGTSNNTTCSYLYSAPEIIAKTYDPSSAPNITSAFDMFSAGCVLYEMITGKRYLTLRLMAGGAFYDGRVDLPKQAIKQCKEEFFTEKIKEAMPGLGEEETNQAVQALMGMLNPDPKQRISPEELAKLPFFKQ